MSKFYWQKLQEKLVLTYLILAIIIAVYLYMMVMYHTTEENIALYEMGAQFSLPMVLHNEWWRLLTSGFLHSGFDHLLMNGIMIYYLGSEIELLAGRWRFLVTYLLALIGGNLLSFALTDWLSGEVFILSVGASGAVYGLFGLFVALAIVYPQFSYLKTRASMILLYILLGFIFGGFQSGVDHFAHAGGFIYGLLAGFLVGLPQMTHSKWLRMLALSLIFILSIASYYWGVHIFWQIF